MSDFWLSDLGEVTGSEKDAFAKDNKRIPDGTMALAKIEAFENAEDKYNKHLSIRWVLTDGDYSGRKVTQKIKVYGDSAAKDKDASARSRHRALNMLKLIYQLYKVSPKHSGEPTDQDLMVFNGKFAGIKIQETPPNDKGDTFNWVSEVHNPQGFICKTGVSLVVEHTNSSTVESAFSRQRETKKEDMLDDIPF